MKTGVIGSGTMGAGIAQVFAMSGHEVILYDIQLSSLERARQGIERNLQKALELGKINADNILEIQGKIKYSSEIQDLRADLILEAIVELPGPKIDLFNQLATFNSESCIFATNTSSIPITRIAAGVSHPERVVGIHFFNPAHIMKLVEVVEGAHTSKEVLDWSVNFVKSIGKIPIVAKDAPGFIVNRVARHYYVEALKVLEEGVCDHQTIDELMEASGFKMGPFRLMDLIGVDTNYSVTESMFQLFQQDAKFRPSRIQKQKVDAGFHGRKTGKGFYTYE